jgi:para-aminobenzoate synthetase component 1
MSERSIVVEPWQAGTPEVAAARLREARGLVWLDSALAVPRTGQWSVVACEPRWTLTARARLITLEDTEGVRTWTADPLAALTTAIETEGRPEVDPSASALPFIGGAIGYLGFELGRHIERLPATTVDDVGAPEMAMAWYDAALVWDGDRDTGWLVGTRQAVAQLREQLEGRPFDMPSAARSRGRLRTSGAEASAESDRLLQSNFSRERYCAAVERALRYIEAGDIYQVNLSQRFSTRVREDGVDLYRLLRSVSPAPFAAYLSIGGVEVLSSSPERLLLAADGCLETRPIKGTRPRGMTPFDDERLAAELRSSAKDGAEHVMIVDLERNDLGRIAEIGSVRVSELAALESFAQVHHLTSTVIARRRADVGLEAMLRAVFPGGSVTGAPKVRALEIIDKLEPTVRGVYTGAIGYFSAHGRADLNVAIRTVTLVDGIAYAHVGGAIVADSDPGAEYRETLDKARGMARALGALLPDEGHESTRALAAAEVAR